MDWFAAFQQASNNMQTANAIKNQQALGNEAAEKRELEALQKAIQAGDPSAMNDYGLWLYQSGNRELGLEYFTRSSIAGQTEALSSFTWYSLKNGNYDDAITLYKACRVKLKFGDTPYQLANCDSNFWLNNLAIGGSEKDAEKAWLINGAKSNHTESLFFPIVLMHKAGNIKLRDEYASKLNKQQWKAMSDEMLEEQMTSTGWFKKWCHDSYEMIVELGKN
jgi:Tfp pilus assembly protein PilF